MEPAHAADGGNDERGIGGSVREAFALPKQVARFFVEGDDRTFGAAGGRQTTLSPSTKGDSEKPQPDIMRPLKSAFSSLRHRSLPVAVSRADEVATGAQHVEQFPIDRRRSTRSFRITNVADGLAATRAPNLFAIFCIKTPDHFVLPAITSAVNTPAGDGRSGVAPAQAGDFPEQRWACGRPLGKQASLGGNVVTVGPVPLRPITGRGGAETRGENEQGEQRGNETGTNVLTCCAVKRVEAEK